MTARIIIPAHNHTGMTDACLRAVLATIDAAAEVVLVDDASNPPLECAATTDPRVRVLRNETSLGFAGSCNSGAEGTSAEFLVFLNNDTTPLAGWLEAMLRCAGEDPTVGIVGCRLLYSDETVQHAGIAFSQSDGEPRHIYRGFPGNHPAVVQTRHLQAVTGACLLIRRTLFEALGGFDSTYENGFEDVDLCLSAIQAGHAVAYCGEAVVSHLEAVSRRPDSASPSGAESHNRSKFAERWAATVRRDEVSLYAEDGLIAFAAGDIYPLQMTLAPELATALGEQTTAGLAQLLNVRSRQVFDLEKEIGYLTARVLDHEAQP
ncbi:MAG: glycosyltransferase family 2 protein [Thermoleophilia bacterium]|nr:glycosyltransferase family 2 protein [Thermoleophilia bacterium]